MYTKQLKAKEALRPKENKQNMYKKIVFVGMTKFNARDYKLLGVERLENNGFRVEFWDISYVTNPEYAESYTPPDAMLWQGNRVFKEKKEITESLRALNKDILVIHLPWYNMRSHFTYKAISESPADYACLMCYACPLSEFTKTQAVLRNIKKFFKSPVQTAARYIFQRIPFRLLGIKPARFVFAMGEKPPKFRGVIGDNTEVIGVHDLCYDRYLEEMKIPYTEKQTAVFMDQYLPFHSEYRHMGQDFPDWSEKYYELINKFFDRVERELGLHVVIAAHPRSEYENGRDYFNGRKCVRGETTRLIRESKLVLTNFSISVNFACLFYKPVMFLTFDELDRTADIGADIKAFAKAFKKPPLYIDRKININWQKELKVNKADYDEYRRIYIKADGSEDLPYWQIVANRLKKTKEA